MTIKRAIKVLKDMVPKTCKMVNGRYVGGFEDTECPQFEAIQVAVEAIQKQMPKKVTHEATLYKCCTCPNCKNVVDEFTEFMGNRCRVAPTYCKYCGQALKWRDSE